MAAAAGEVDASERADGVDLRHRRAVVHPGAGGARGARLPRPGRRGRLGRPAGLRLAPTSRRRATAWGFAGCCCSPYPPRTCSVVWTTPRSSAWRVAVRVGPRAARRLRVAAAGELVDHAGPSVTSRPLPRWPRPPGESSASGRVGCWPRCCACWASGARSSGRSGPGGHGGARLGERHARCLERLVHRGFIAEAGAPALRQYPRYLAALLQRRERLDTEPRRDAELMARVDPLQQAWQHRMDALPAGRPPGADCCGAVDARGVPRLACGRNRSAPPFRSPTRGSASSSTADRSLSGAGDRAARSPADRSVVDSA